MDLGRCSNSTGPNSTCSIASIHVQFCVTHYTKSTTTKKRPIWPDEIRNYHTSWVSLKPQSKSKYQHNLDGYFDGVSIPFNCQSWLIFSTTRSSDICLFCTLHIYCGSVQFVYYLIMMLCVYTDW